MVSHLKACVASGMSVTNYCKEYNLPKSKYYYWHKQLNSSQLLNSFSQVSPFKSNCLSDAPIVIHFPNGVEVVFKGSYNTQVIKELICCM